MKILLVEDDVIIADNIKMLLQRSGYVTSISKTVEDAIDLLHANEYDLVICDRRLPDGDGLEIAKNLRQSELETPILMLTAKATKNDLIEGLNQGADDYLSKPYDSEVLLAKVRVLLRRRHSKTISPVTSLGSVEVNSNTHEVKLNGNRVDLSPKEYALLDYLIANKERIIERVEILSHVWDDEVDLFSNTVDVHVRYLRQKLGDQIVKTVRGKGYLLCTQN